MRFPGHGRGPSDRRESVFHAVSGGHSEGETPGPIPNPEVKPFCADGTARGTAWESRTPPGIFEGGCSPKGLSSLLLFLRAEAAVRWADGRAGRPGDLVERWHRDRVARRRPGRPQWPAPAAW